MSIKETIQKLRELQKAEAEKLNGIEVLGFKVREYAHSSRGNKYKSFYAVKCENGKKTQIFLGIPESVEEVKAKIEAYLQAKSSKKK